jgi:hypothetical protein
MFSITINGEDFGDELLREDGITDLDRSVSDELDFSPVSSSVTVRLSDIGGRVSSFMGLPKLENPLLFFSGLTAIQGDTDFRVKIFDDGEPYFFGHIKNETIAHRLVDTESPNEEKIVQFTVYDDTKWFFEQWDLTRLTSTISNGGDWFYRPTPPLMDMNFHSIPSLFEGAILGSSFHGAPMVQGVTSSDDLSGIYFWTWRLFDLWLRMEAQNSVPTLANFLLDLTRLCCASAYVDLNGVLHIDSLPSTSAGHGLAVIDEYEVIDSTPIQERKIQYIHDIRSDMNGVMPPGGIGAYPVSNGFTTAWWYWKDGALASIIGDQQEPVGNIFEAIPLFANFLDTMTWFDLIWTQEGGWPRPYFTQLTRSYLLRKMLKTRRRFRVRCPGRSFFPFQPVQLTGILGWKTVSANIQPMNDESELLLETIA